MKKVIHFTKTFSNVSSILNSSSLRLKYCQEEFELGDNKISQAAHPMVCFSKLDINLLSKMKITYGRYGIAFNDDWVHRNKIHPVLYFDRESALANALAKLLRARQNQENSKLPDSLRLPIMILKCFTKNANGYNRRLKVKDFNFADESEWRFVPSKKDISNGLISQNLSAYLKSRDAHNRKLLPFPLRFTRGDISKIFVATKAEVKLLENMGFSGSLVSVSRWKTDDSQRQI